MRSALRILLALVMVWTVTGCKEKLPSRDQIPVLRKTLGNLERAMLTRNPAAIDSLASVDLLHNGLSSDSLLSLAYGPNRDRSFARLGNYQIFYNREVSVIDCDLKDSTDAPDPSVKLYFKLETDKRWLLTRFEVIGSDSAR